MLLPLAGVQADTNIVFTHGVITARIVGPYQPTPETVIPSPPGIVTNFWVTLDVVDVRDGFASDLKGKTIKLPTTSFDQTLVGSIVPMTITKRVGDEEKPYWLTCTSVGISVWRAEAETSANKK